MFYKRILYFRTGLVTVSKVARLDRDTNPDHYAVVINAVDAGFPIPETATTTLYVNIDDVNDKAPRYNRTNPYKRPSHHIYSVYRFKQPTYAAYISERTSIGTEILKVIATDSDLDSRLFYSIVKPIKAASKTGTQLSSKSPYKYLEAFHIDNETGTISVNRTLNHDLAAEITVTVKVEDINAAYNIDKQFDTAEAAIYIQSFKDTNPIFLNKGWTSLKPILYFTIKEEMPIGSTLFVLSADDPVTGRKIQSFRIVNEDRLDMFTLHDRTGEVMLKRRLDYEALNETSIVFSVQARSMDGRATVTTVNVTVENVNDNIPEFEKRLYRATVIETAKYPTELVTVHAQDTDAVLNDFDRHIGYHSISYSLSGSDAGLFTINNVSGVIRVAHNQTLDREKQSVLRFTVTAEDAPGRPTETRRSTADVVIDVLDVNDNAPVFSQKVYSAVIPETADVDTVVAKVIAVDPDEGPGGEVRYDFLNEGDANGLLRINPVTGEIRTRVQLTGKGRSDPYEFVVRAQDNGGQLPKQESLHSDVSFTLYIGDVSENDGIPFFISPKIGQIANITENATIGSPVFQVIASDPDNPSTPSGSLTYRIQDDIADANSFRIGK